jgi:periplasmic copper chaperone A
MRRAAFRLACVWVAFCCTTALARADGRIGVFDAWIRAAPPGASMLAGYATLKNTGDAPITILTVQSDEFRLTSLHETVVEDGVARMREMHRLQIPVGGEVQLAPGGKHLMFMHPRSGIGVGDQVGVTFLMADGARVETYFDVVAPDSVAD